jgi:uncharacterized RDD family membrane protein YckC
MNTREVQIDTCIDIVTPENIAFQYRIAGPFRRVAAFALDFGIRFAAFCILMMAITPLQLFSGGFTGGFALVALFFLDWFYGVFCESYFNGQTPGKRMMGIRVLTTKGRPINGMQAALRNLLRYADLMPFLSFAVLFNGPPMMKLPAGLIGLICCSLSSRFQRLGDLVCGTMVVVEERSWLLGVTPLEDPRTPQLAEALPPDFVVTRSMARALAAYVERRKNFPPPRRRQVASYLAQPLLERFGLPSDTSYDLLLCALYYRTFVADRPAVRDTSFGPGPGNTGPAEETPYVIR